MRKMYLAGFAMAAVPVAANAQTVSKIYTNNVYTVPAYISNAVSVENFEGPAIPNSPSEMLTGGATAKLFSGTVPGQGVDNNPNSSGQYLSIQSGGPTGGFQFTFATPVQVLSFVIGSLDLYNSVTLTFANGTSQMFSGASILPASQPVTFDPNGNSSPNGTNAISGRVTYDMGGTSGITKALFASSSAAFEIDDVVTSAPEPAAWALMILGFGLVGGALRLRRRGANVAFA